MNKRFVMIIIFVFTVVLLCSCSKTKTKEEILKEAENYTSTSTEYDSFAYQADIGKWLAPETEYNYDKNGDTIEGITNFFGYSTNKDRIYFQISKPTPQSSGDTLWAYISLDTGEKHYICPDPLCGHTVESGCKYSELQNLIFNPDSDSKACAYKFNNNIIIYEIDFSNDTLTEKYISGKLEPNSVRNFIEFLFIDENKLYFLDTYKLKEESDEEKEEREIIETEKRYLLSLDLSDGSFEVLNDNFRGGANCICTLNDRVFFNDYAENRIYTTDMNFENEATILEYDDNLSIKDISYDENTGEFYVLMATYDTSVNSNAVEGNLYFIDSEMNCEKISMPSEQILNFRLTKEYFYYMVYDPVSYGNSPRGMACIDETGSKIYRVKRGEMSEPELVFDGRGEIFYSNFEVIGNYLYLDYMQLIKMDSMAWFRYAYSTARINIKDKTIKWLNLD